MPSAPLAAASRASSGSRMPLMTSGPSHCSRTHSTSFQVTLASKLAPTQPIKSASTAPEPSNGFEVAHGQRPPAYGDIPCPVRPLQHLPHPAAGAAHRAGHARPIVAVAGAGHREVDGEQQRAAARRLRPRDHVADETAVLDDVQLEPERCVAALRDFLDRAAAQSREGKGHIRRCGRPCGLHFAPPRVEARKSHRAQADRHRPALPKQFRRKVDRRDIAQHALPQGDRLQILDIPPQSHFVVRTAVEIFEQEMRQPRFRERAVIADVGRLFAQLSSRSSDRADRPCASAPARRADWPRARPRPAPAAR